MCRGTQVGIGGGLRRQGLSPRVRGNPVAVGQFSRQVGSIPACAGEPQPAKVRITMTTVYPRVCGGTAAGDDRHPLGHGLSPRVRGNPSPLPACLVALRSIPACAGEPGLSDAVVSLPEVYPRVCGGTPRTSTTASVRLGLSPRVRGNPVSAPVGSTGLRSIPACAGEPRQPRLAC